MPYQVFFSWNGGKALAFVGPGNYNENAEFLSAFENIEENMQSNCERHEQTRRLPQRNPLEQE